MVWYDHFTISNVIIAVRYAQLSRCVVCYRRCSFFSSHEFRLVDAKRVSTRRRTQHIATRRLQYGRVLNGDQNNGVLVVVVVLFAGLVRRLYVLTLLFVD